MKQVGSDTQQEKNLRLLLEMSDEQMASLFQLLVDQPHLSTFVAKRKAFQLVFGSIQRGILWVTGFAGALWLGAEKLKAVLDFLVQWIMALF